MTGEDEPVLVSSLIDCAQGNDAGAQYDVAMIYMNGDGVSVTRSEAYFWFSVCIRAQGIFWSPDPDSLRERLACGMTGLDVFLAERRAEEWIDRHGPPIARDDT